MEYYLFIIILMGPVGRLQKDPLIGHNIFWSQIMEKL